MLTTIGDPRQAALRSGHEREALGRQIAATDAQIDRLVYDLYGLSEEEIRLVEEATACPSIHTRPAQPRV